MSTLADNYDSNSEYSDDDILDGGEQVASALYVNESLKSVNTVATTTSSGLMAAADKVKLDGIETEANKYVHPVNHPPSIITQDANNRFVTDNEKTTWNGKAVTGSTGSWTTLILVDSWVAFGIPYATPSYRKDQFGKLKLKGVVKDGSGVIANLPVGSRPTEDLTFIVLSNNGTNDIVGRVTITSTGDIQFVSGSNVLLSLDSIPEIYVS